MKNIFFAFCLLVSFGAKAQIQMNDALKVVAQKSVDDKQYMTKFNKHVPYDSVSQFLYYVPKTRRHIGEICYIYDSSLNIDIWQFKGGIDSINLHKIESGISDIFQKGGTDSVFYVKGGINYFAFKNNGSFATNHPYPVQHISDMLALSANIGDIAIVADSSKSYVLSQLPASTQVNWLELLSPVLATTDFLPEGTTNLYYTDSRARNSISGGTGITYNPATGVIDNSATGGGSGIDSASFHKAEQVDSTSFNIIKPNGDTTTILFHGLGGGSEQVNADWNATSGAAQILNKPLINNATTSGIIDPLLVTWTGTGLGFDISAGSFIFKNVTHYVNASTVTLDAADATYPRIDAFYVDTLGNTGKITGVAEANPVAPQVTYGQFLLTTVQIDAAATTPSNVNLTTIYDENTEWTTSKTGTGTVDFNDATNPYSGSKDIKVSAVSTGLTLVFTNPSGVDTAGIGDVLRMFFYTANNLTSGYSIQFFSGTNPVSSLLSINSIGYGFNPTTLSTHQNVFVPFSAFTFYSPYYNKVAIKTLGANSNTVYFDLIQIQKGMYQFAPTDYSNKLDSVTNVGGDLYQWAKGSSKFVAPLGGSGVQSVTGTTVDNTDPLNPVVSTPNFNNVADASHEGLDDFAKMDDRALMVVDNTNSGTSFLGVANSDLTKAIQIGSEYGTESPYLDYVIGANGVTVKADSAIGGVHVLYLPSSDGTLVSTVNNRHPDKFGNVTVATDGITQPQLDDSTAAIRNDKQDKLTLTTTGTSGAATLTGSTLNIPNYVSGGSYTASSGVVLQGNNFKLQDTLNGAGTKIMWIPSLKAFRAGYVNGTQWDISNVGSGSSAFGGGGSIASGGNSFALGILTNASGYASFVQGFGSVASGSYSASFGSSFSKALYSFASGDGSEANYYSSLALGSHVSTDSLEGSISLGIWNDRSFNKNRIFQIGIGTSTSDKKNGVTLLNTGKFQLNQYGSGTFTGTPTKQLSVTSTGDIIETNQPIITSGTSAPSSTPAKVGDIYVDITAKKLYFATGTSSSSDWTIAN